MLDLGALPAALRALLVADGTVTILLGALSGEAVRATPVDADPPARAANLEMPATALARAVMLHGQDSGVGYCFARSLLLPGRLPDGFLPALRQTAAGIGGAFEGLALETRRVLAWRGRRRDVAVPPDAAAAFAGGGVSRCYAIHHGGVPTVIIEENFPAGLAL